MGLIAKQGAAGTQPWLTAGSQVSVAGGYNAKSAVGVVAFLPCAGFPFLGVAFVPVGTVSGGGTAIIEVSSDGGATWNSPNGIQYALAGGVPGQITAAFAIATTGASVYLTALPGTTHARVRITATMTGSGAMLVQLGANSSGGRTDVVVTSTINTVNVNTNQIASIAPSALTIAVQASTTSAITNVTTARTTTTGWAIYKSVDFLLNITAAGVATGTLQIYIQDSVDGGTTWDDVVSFNTFAFAASLTTQRASVQGAIVTTRAGTAAQQVQTLAAGTIRQGPFGDRFKVVEVVSGVSGSPTGATYRVDAIGHL